MAQTPPPFNPATPVQASSNSGKTCLIVAIVVIAFCLVAIIAGGMFFSNMFGQVMSAAGCMSTFSATENALKAYALEHNGKLPPAKTWMQDIEPYYRRLYEKQVKTDESKFFKMIPPGQVLECTWDNKKTGIAFNSDLGGKRIKDVKDPSTTALIFEVDAPAMNLAQPFKQRNTDDAPSLFNTKDRDWTVFYLEGNENPFQSKTKPESSFEFNPEDALPEGSKPAEPVKPEGA